MAKRSRSNTPIPPDGDSDNQDPNGGNRSTDGGSDIAPATDPSGSSVIDPGSIGTSDGSSDSDSPRQRKQRSDRGTKRGPRGEKADKIDLGDFAQILSEIHSAVALLVDVPELSLDESKDEHIKLARAIERVKRHYDLPSVSPIALDWFLLAKTCALIYGSRIIAFNLRRRADNARPINPPSAVQHQKPPQPTAPPPSRPTPTPPADAPLGMKPPPSHIRAAAIPGFENVVIDVPVGTKAN